MGVPIRSFTMPDSELDYMRPYGAVISISDNSRSAYSRVYNDRVEVDLQFHNHDTYRQFRRDLLGVQDMRTEYTRGKISRR